MKHIYKNFNFYGIMELICEFIRLILQSIKLIYQSTVGTSYTSEDEDILGADEDYTALEDALRREVANIESTHPGYDEYRYHVDELGHNPYELASYLTAKLRHYTRENVQGELRSLFEAQYRLTLTEEVETRYRTETRTGTSTSTDPETGETTTEEYEYD